VNKAFEGRFYLDLDVGEQKTIAVPTVPTKQAHHDRIADDRAGKRAHSSTWRIRAILSQKRSHRHLPGWQDDR